MDRHPPQYSNALYADRWPGNGWWSGGNSDLSMIWPVIFWLIFPVSREIPEPIPAKEAAAILNPLITAANELLEYDFNRSHDITCAVFQTLIADRKFLAAWYTTPASAAMLAGLALPEETTPSGGSWNSRKDVEALRTADFACGTGTLLSTSYHRVSPTTRIDQEVRLQSNPGVAQYRVDRWGQSVQLITHPPTRGRNQCT